MQKILTFLTAICMLYAVTSRAQLPDPYTIAVFNVTDADIIETNNFAIKSPAAAAGSDTLLDIGSPPSFIRPKHAVMRKKFGADYRLYYGELDTAIFRIFPTVYSFPIPEWSRSGQAMWYRFFSKPTDNRNLDIETVFFDNERIYVQHHKKIYYSRNDAWDSIVGVTEPPIGELYIDSEPPGADIYFYGKSTGKRTPAVFSNLVAGKYEIELFLQEYSFQRRSVSVPAGGIASSSFQLMSDFDTLHVVGENQHGILVLPYPPTDSVYRIGDSAPIGFQEQLLAGDYRVTWNGGGLYNDIDTVITVTAAQMNFFNAPFVRLMGTAVFEIYPEDALICIEGFPCHLGGLTVDLPSGFHSARITRYGYEPERRKFVIGHGKKYLIRIPLETTDDRDFDGFPDPVDKCPDVWGLYDGCPKPEFKHIAKLRYMELVEYMETEPFSFSVSLIGLVNRSPTSRKFNTFLANFSGGQTGGLDNYKGVSIGNIYQASYRGFMAQAELGQWLSGVKFRRPNDTISINTESGRYRIWYDSLYNIDPGIFFPSTALSVGFKYRIDRYSVGYSLGFQWEDIILEQIERCSDGELLDIRFDNDWWFHEIMLEVDMFTDMFATPSLYTKFKLPFGPTMRTKWHSFQIGLLLRMRPINWKKRI